MLNTASIILRQGQYRRWCCIRFYVSKTANRKNGRPFIPEAITPYVCVSPYYPVHFHHLAAVLLDSGAFQDVGKHKRLSFQDALLRQMACERRCGFTAEKLVSYDRLVDEQLDEAGQQIKKRWAVNDAEDAVEETVAAARFLASQREQLRPRRLVLSNQGTTVEQYTRCVTRVLEVATPDDVLGYGGFCIVGQRRNSLTPDACTYPVQFLRVLEATLPLVAEAGIRDAHLFGVMVVPLLREATVIAKRFGVDLSTDSSTVEKRSVIDGRVWGIDGWTNVYLGRENKWTGQGKVPSGKWHPNLLAHENIGRAVKTLEGIA